MADKILDYRTVTSPEQARETIEDFENRYHCEYSWGKSHGGIDDAVVVCLLELDSRRRFVTTSTGMKYVNFREVVKAIDLGEL